jgi:phenylpyruvate tautomerase PptA (4-oxalocrotonate tautomerase family)
MERSTILTEKQKLAAVVTDIDVSSLNRYRPKIVVTREEFKAATEENIGNAGEFS